MLDRHDYGWVEFIAAKSCEHPQQVENFYYRLGGYLALLYAIEGTDFHAENTIAAGEHPVLIDLESLFHPRANAPDSPNAKLPARQKISQSVLRVGLLPKLELASRKERGFDVSAIGGNYAQIYSPKMPNIADFSRNEIQQQNDRQAIGDNQPRLNGEAVNVLDYQDAIARGFTDIYRSIVQHRDEFCEFLNCFAGDEVRVILRETRSYGLLLRESFHPDVLRDALDRDRLFDRLWVEVPTFPYLAAAINAEKTTLWQGDIPKFLTRPNSRNLWLENGECIPDFFDRTGLELVRNRLLEFNEADLSQQLWLIRTSLTAMAAIAQPQKSPTYAVPKPDKAPDRKTANAAYLQAAIAVADRLESLAICQGDFAGWIAPVFAGNHRWTVHTLGWDLFDGMPGIAIFLAYLGAIVGDDRYSKLANSALRSILHQVKYEGYLINSIGAFNGWAGLIYTFTHLGRLWQQPELISQAVIWAQKLPPLIEKDEQLDIIGGAAGCIHVLSGLYQYVGDDRLKIAAIKCGDRLLKTARSMPQGIGWITLPECQPLTGFSHGAAGISRALFELAAFSGEQRFQEAAIGAIDYERSLFSQQMKNWPDLRFEWGDRVLFGLGWSHGAPGSWT
ncbi:MAG: type 2 lantipeptide synthetase LanM, partial [Microcoleus sp. SM1_3_4]|nr:type 2 lantipeptide synthetase LanM [Microcoleus sp. SM1_3_4]